MFLRNLEERLPHFLTATIVNITKSLTMQKDYFREHRLWPKLEEQLIKRRKFLDNEQLAQVIHAFGVTGSGSRFFFQEMEEIVVDSPIKIETENLIKIMQGYAEIDQGSPEFFSDCIQKILLRGLDEFERPSQLTDIAKILSKSTNM